MSKNHFALAAAFLMGCSALAQDSTRVRQLDEVVITATRFPIKQSQTGKVVTVITKEDLQRSLGKSLGQVLNEQAGIVINGALNSPGTNQTVFMRGASSGRTLVLLDGIPVNDPSFIYNEFDINLVSIFDIQRIEVCRGAQSTLYGSDAIAGVINIITIDKDILKPLQVSSTLAGGNQGTFKGNVQLAGKKDRLSYSLRYSKLHTDGFSSAHDSSGKKNFDKDGLRGNIANGQVQFQASQQLLFKTFFQYNQYENDIDAGGFTDDRDYTVNNKNIITGGGFQFKKDIVTLTGNYQYSEIKRNYLDDSASIGGFAKFSSNKYSGKAHFLELYASTKIGGGLTLLQGGDYRRVSMNNQFLSISSFGPFTTSFRDTSMSQGSIYASLNYNGTGTRLNVELGGRLNVHSRYGNNSTYTFNPSFNITKNYRVFGSIATGFKAPSLYQLYDGVNGNPALKAENSLNYEFGLQQKHDKFSNRVVFFYRDIDDGIDYNYITRKYFNFFKQITRGIEYEVSVMPTDFLSINANYTYLSISETTQNRVLLNKDTTYRYGIKRPKHSVNANANFRFTPAFSFGVTARYVSDRNDVGGYKIPDVLLDSYMIFGAHASYEFNEHINLFADCQNFTDKKFFDSRGYNAIPITAIGGISLKW